MICGSTSTATATRQQRPPGKRATVTDTARYCHPRQHITTRTPPPPGARHHVLTSPTATPSQDSGYNHHQNAPGSSSEHAHVSRPATTETKNARDASGHHAGPRSNFHTATAATARYCHVSRPLLPHRQRPRPDTATPTAAHNNKNTDTATTAAHDITMTAARPATATRPQRPQRQRPSLPPTWPKKSPHTGFSHVGGGLLSSIQLLFSLFRRRFFRQGPL